MCSVARMMLSVIKNITQYIVCIGIGQCNDCMISAL